MNYFTIKRKLPSLNDYIRACRANKYQGAKFKAEIEEAISLAIGSAQAAETLRKPEGKVIVNIEWHEKTKKRDADNIASAKKFILDALVKNGILEDDGRKYVVGFHDTIVDDKEDYVQVELIDL
jgi:Holliday junction resolvase RusA-like endonuclease